MQVKTNTGNLVGVHFHKPSQAFCNKFTDIANRILLIDEIKGQVLLKNDKEMVVMVDEFCLNFFPTGVVMTSPVFFHEDMARFVLDENKQNFTFTNIYSPLFSNRSPVVLDDKKYVNYTNLFFVTASMIFNQIAHATSDINLRVLNYGHMQYHYIKRSGGVFWPFYEKFIGETRIEDWQATDISSQKRFENTGSGVGVNVNVVSPSEKAFMDYGLILDYQAQSRDLKIESCRSFQSVCHSIELLEKDSISSFDSLSVFDYAPSLELDMISTSQTVH